MKNSSLSTPKSLKSTPISPRAKLGVCCEYTRDMYSMMTICTGNVCRSPVAEYLLRAYAEQEGLEVTVASSGLSNEEEGNPVDPRTDIVLREHGIDASAHRAKVFTPEDFERYDLLLALDVNHFLRLSQMAPTAEHREKIRMLRSFAPNMQGKSLDEQGIFDPWYGEMKDFYTTYDLMDASAKGVIAALKEGKL